MGMFGAPTQKGTFLYSCNHSLVTKLSRKRDSSQDHKWDTSLTVQREPGEPGGRDKITGSKTLKGTQAYMLEFGSAVYKAW
eukprot:6404638-Alexandrium_andersonii.AAC.1